MPHHPKLLTKDEMGLEAPNPLTLHYQRDLNLRLGISCSFARSYADQPKAFSSYFWLTGEDGRPTCAVHVSATEFYDYAVPQ